MSDTPKNLDDPFWRAYGPEKEAWKAEGNYFTAEELRQMAADFKELTIKPIPKRIYVVE